MSGTTSTANRLAGVASVTIDGTSYMLVGEPTWQPGSTKNETLVGLDGVHGYAQTFTPPFMSCTLRDSGALTVADFYAMTNSTVQFQLANGKMVSGSGMWITEAVSVKSAEGTFEVKFEGFQVAEDANA